jgi:hypothetical protein
LKVFRHKLVAVAHINGHFVGLRLVSVNRPLCHLMQKMVPKHLQYRSADWNPGKREHPLQPFVNQAHREIRVGNQNAFTHATQNCSETQVFVCNQLGHFPLPMFDPPQLMIDLANDSRAFAAGTDASLFG